MRPPVPYYGGKQTLAPTIAALLPERDHYVEPFAGSLAVLLARQPSRMETVNDLDGDLMLFWQVLRDHPAELRRACQLTPHSRAERATAAAYLSSPTGERAEVTALERARLVWVALTQGRAGVLRRTGWKYHIDPNGSPSTGMPGYLDGYVQRMATVAERLHHVSLEARPALEIIRAYGGNRDVLLYVDPPYLGTTRPGSNPRQYRHEMYREADHRELADALRACAAAVVVSGYPCQLYDSTLYADWYRHELPAATGQGGSWKHTTEVLWSNRPLRDQPALWAAL